MCSSIFKNVIYLEKIDSTQKELWRRIDKNLAKDGTIIISDIQTDAIGTHGRKWYTSQKGNIAFSFVLYPNIPVVKIKDLTIDIAKLILNIFNDLYNIKLMIKKPNDIVINNKKIGGILTQTKLQGEIVKTLVIGIGINTNQTNFDEEIKDTATSIKKEFDIYIDTSLFINEFGYKFKDIFCKRLGTD